MQDTFAAARPSARATIGYLVYKGILYTKECQDVYNNKNRQLTFIQFDGFFNADFESPPHDVGLKCFTDKLSAKTDLIT